MPEPNPDSRAEPSDPEPDQEFVDDFAEALENPGLRRHFLREYAEAIREGRLDERTERIYQAALDEKFEQARESKYDHLTGLPNRRALEGTERRPGEWERAVADARREGRPIALIIFDLKEFKLINEERGHNVGDEVLKGVGSSLSKRALREVGLSLSARIRGGDTAFRMAGDEFALILSDIETEEQAESVVHLLAERFPDDPVTGKPVGVNKLMGTAVYRPDQDPESAQELLKGVWASVKQSRKKAPRPSEKT